MNAAEMTKEIRSLSSGTIATISGEKDYQVIDLICDHWLQWLNAPADGDCCGPAVEFETWQDCWNAFAADLYAAGEQSEADLDYCYGVHGGSKFS